MPSPVVDDILSRKPQSQDPQDWQAWCDEASRALSLVEDPISKSDLSIEMGRAFHRYLDRKDLAIEALIAGLEFDPTRSSILEELGAIYAEKNENINDILQHLQTQATAAETPEEQINLWMEIADIYWKALTQLASAEGYFRKVLSLNSGYELAWQNLEQVLIQSDNWTGLAKLYQEWIATLQAQAVSSERVSRIHFSLAALYKDKINDLYQAYSAYSEILEKFPQNLQAKIFLDQLGQEKMRWRIIAQDFVNEGIKGKSVDTSDLEKSLLIYEKILKEFEGAKTVCMHLILKNPDQEKWFEQLELLCQHFAVPHTYVALLESLSPHLTSDAERGALFHRIALTHSKKFLLLQPAIVAIEKAIEIDGTNVEYLRTAEWLYSENSDWEASAKKLESLLALSLQVENKINDQRKLGLLYTHKLNKPEKAIALLHAVLNQNPNDTEIVLEIEALYRAQSDFAQLDDFYPTAIRLLKGKPKEIEFILEHGLILKNHLNRPTDALEKFKLAYRLAPHQERGKILFEKELLAQKQYFDLCQFYNEQAEVAERSAIKTQVLKKMAQTLDLHLGDYKRSIEVWRQALEINPSDEDIYFALSSLYEKTHAWKDLLNLLEQWIIHCGKETQDHIDVYLRMAEISEDRLAAFAQAIVYYQKVIVWKPEHDIALKGLERLYLRQESWPDLYDNYRSQLRLVGDTTNPQNSNRQVYLLRRMAVVCQEHLQNPVLAQEHFEQILKIHPSDKEALGEIRLFFQGRKQWIDLVNTYEREIKVYRDRDLVRCAHLMREIATVFEEHLNDQRMSLEYLKQAAVLNPADPTISNALIRLYESNQYYPELVEIYQTKLLAAQTISEKTTLHRTLATLLWTKLKDGSRASLHFDALLDLSGKDADWLLQSRQFYTANHLWGKVIEVLILEKNIATSESQRLGIHFQIAEVYREHLNDSLKAFSFYETVLAENPRHIESRKSVCAFFRSNQNWIEFAKQSELLLQHLTSQDEKIPILRELTDVWVEVFHDEQKGLNAIEALLEIKPKDPVALKQRFALACSLHLWQKAVDACEKLLEHTPDSNQRHNLHQAMAGIFERNLGDPDLALKHYWIAFELAAVSPAISTAMTADSDLANQTLTFDCLKSLAISEKRWSLLADAYRLKLTQTRDTDQRLSLSLELGDLYRLHLGDRSSAKQIYLQALQEAPLNMSLLRSLKEVLTDSGLWEDLEKEHFQRLPLGEQTNPWIEGAMIFADGWIDQFHFASRGMQTLQNAKRRFPDHLLLLSHYNLCLKKQELWQEYLPSAIAEIQLRQNADDPNAKKDLPALFLTVARLHWREIVDLEKATQFLFHYTDIMGMQRETLEEFEPLLIEQHEWIFLIQSYETVASQVETNALRADFLTKAAVVTCRSLNQKPQAKALFERALVIDPNHREALEGMIGLMDPAVETTLMHGYQERLATILGPCPHTLNLFIEMATTALRYLKDFALAETHALNALSIDAKSKKALDLLESIYLETNNHEKRLQVFRKMEKLFLPPEEEFRIARALGDLYRHELQEPEMAFASYIRGVDLQPRNTEFLNELEAWLREHKIDSLLQIYFSKRLEDSEIPLHQRASWLCEKARIFLKDHQKDSAISHFEMALGLNPANAVALKALIPLYRESGKHQRLAETLDIYCATAESTEKPALLFELGEIWVRHLKNPLKALEYFQRLLNLDPKHFNALQELRSIFLALDRAEAFLETSYILRQHVSPQDLPLQISIEEDIARILIERVHRPQEAIPHLHWLLRNAPEETGKETWPKLERIYIQAGLWNELNAFYRETLEKHSSMTNPTEVRQKMADVFLKHLSDPANAILVIEDVLTHFRTEEKWDECIRVAHGLKDLYKTQNQQSQHLQILDQLFFWTKSEKDRLALLWEKLELEQGAMGLKNEARVTLEKILEINPESKEAIKRILPLLHSDTDKKLLRKLYRKMIDLEEGSALKAQHCHTLASLYGNDKGKKIALLQEGLQASVVFEPLLRDLFSLLIEAKNWSEAIVVLDHLIARDPNPDRLLLKAEILLFGLKQESQAEEAFVKTLERDPHCKPALTVLAKRALESGDDQTAKAMFSKLSFLAGVKETLSEGGPPAWVPFARTGFADDDIFFHLGEISFRQGDLTQALMFFQQAFHINPNQVAALKAIGDLFDKLNQPKNAIPFYEKILDLKDQSLLALQRPTFHFRLARLYRDLLSNDGVLIPGSAEWKRLLQKAIFHVEALLEIQPQHSQALFLAVEVNQMNDNGLRVLHWIERTLELNLDVSQKIGLLLKKSILLKKSEENKAAETLKVILTLDPDHVEALEQHFELLVKGKQWVEAMSVLTHRKELTADNAQKAHLLGLESEMILQHTGDEAKALGLLEEGRTLDPNNPRIFEAWVALVRKRRLWRDLFAVFQPLVSAVTDSEKRKSYLSILAEVFVEMGPERQAYMAWYEELLKTYPLSSLKMETTLHFAKGFMETPGFETFATNLLVQMLTLGQFDRAIFNLLSERWSKEKRPDLLWPLFSLQEQFYPNPSNSEQRHRLQILNEQSFEANRKRLTQDHLFHSVLIDRNDLPLLRDIFRILSEMGPKILSQFDAIRGERKEDPSVFRFRDALPLFGLDDRRMSIETFIPEESSHPELNSRLAISIPPQRILLNHTIGKAGFESYRAFAVGSTLYLHACGFSLVWPSTLKNTKQFLIALGRQFHPNFALSDRHVILDNSFDHYNRLFKKHLSRSQRKDLKPHMDALINIFDSIALNHWEEGVENSSFRFGYFFCRNLGASLAAIYMLKRERSWSQASEFEKLDFIRKTKSVQDLIGFAFGEPHAAFCRQHGILAVD